MFCPNCGKEIPENIKFCNYCGAEQDVNFSSATFQEDSQQQSYEENAVQQQLVMASRTKSALKLGGFCLVALSVFSILLCFVGHYYEFYLGHYVLIGSSVVILMQSSMIVGGITMISMSNPKAALKIGGSVLLAISALSVLICFLGNRYVFFLTLIRNSTGESIIGGIDLFLVQGSMVVAGVLMIYISKGKGR